MSPPFHIEVVQKPNSHVSTDCIKTMVKNYLYNFETMTPGLIIPNSDFAKDIELSANVFSITFCDERDDWEPDVASITDSAIVYHVYKLNGFGEEQIDAMTDTIGGEEVSFADLQTLPSEGFHGLWESLVYDSQLKQETLRFVETAFEFADRGVDSNIIGWNHVVLFHGPPGTGKTSLCRALAQKLAIRHAARFPRACLLEINAHSLFSKWFSESGKLVAKLFEHVRELVEDKRMLVCILVDEVESLAQARSAAMSGVEPSDSIRAVNALLTQLDRLKRYPNALVLTTSNVTGAIDVAFVDRADIKRRVGPPTERAAFKILCGCIRELMVRGVMPQTEVGELESLRLGEVAKSAAEHRLSARALRRLPFLARALHSTPSDSLTDFLGALRTALLRHLADTADLDDPRPNGDHRP